jgi:hypothetical protein
MRRANDLSGVVLVFIATLPALLTGCKERDPSDSSTRAAFGNSAIASNDLPEVVITAPRPRSKAIVVSARDRGTAPR